MWRQNRLARFRRRCQISSVDIVVVIIIILRHVARLLRAVELGAKLRNHAALNHLAAGRINRVRDIRIELGSPFLIANGAIFLQPSAALIAEAGLEVILAAATAAMAGQLAPSMIFRSRTTKLSSKVTEQKPCRRSSESSMSLIRTSVICIAAFPSRGTHTQLAAAACFHLRTLATSQVDWRLRCSVLWISFQCITSGQVVPAFCWFCQLPTLHLRIREFTADSFGNHHGSQVHPA